MTWGIGILLAGMAVSFLMAYWIGVASGRVLGRRAAVPAGLFAGMFAFCFITSVQYTVERVLG